MAEPSHSHLLGAVAESCGIISRNNGVLANMIAQLDSAHPGDAPDPHDLRMLLQDNASLARETGAQLLLLQRGQGRGMTSHQRAMLEKLGRDFQFVLRRFQQLTQRSSLAAAKQQHNSVQRAAKPSQAAEVSDDTPAWLRQAADLIAQPDNGGAPSSTRRLSGMSAMDERRTRAKSRTVEEEDVEAMGEGHGLLAAEHAREQRQERQLLAARAQEEERAERARMVEQIESTTREVGEIFSELAELISSQSEVRAKRLFAIQSAALSGN